MIRVTKEVSEVSLCLSSTTSVSLLAHKLNNSLFFFNPPLSPLQISLNTTQDIVPDLRKRMPLIVELEVQVQDWSTKMKLESQMASDLMMTIQGSVVERRKPSKSESEVEREVADRVEEEEIREDPSRQEKETIKTDLENQCLGFQELNLLETELNLLRMEIEEEVVRIVEEEENQRTLLLMVFRKGLGKNREVEWKV